MEQPKYVIRTVINHHHLYDIGGGHVGGPEMAPHYTKSQAAAIVVQERLRKPYDHLEIVSLDQAIAESEAYRKDVNERRAKLTK